MGRIGSAIALGLVDPITVVGRYGRDRDLHKRIESFEDTKKICSDVVIISTNDDAIAEVAHLLRSKIENRPIVLHTSGSLGSNILTELKEQGCSVGSMHPLVSVVESSDPTVFERAYFCIEGDERAVASAAMLAQDLGGVPFTIPPDKKPLYHAAAVMAAGHLVALIDMANDLMRGCGVEGSSSLEMLRPLVKSVIDNVFEQGTTRSLTGTYARGDVKTAQRHLEVLDDSVDKIIREVFIDLALRSLEISKRSAPDDAKAVELEGLLTVAKNRDEL